jgi:hypothetical protein
MPKPKTLREDVVRVARNLEPGVTLKSVAADEPSSSGRSR